MLEIDGLTFRYRRHSPPVLQGVDLTLPAGEIGILLGKNGAGKTTLFQCILGICTPTGGSVRLDGAELSLLSRRERARRIAYVPQTIQLGGLPVFDCVLMGRVSSFGLRAGEADRAAAERILAEMGLTDFADRRTDELSGGERQRVAVARALAQEPRLLIFDEPTGNLDPAEEVRIVGEARALAHGKGIAVLCALHDLNRALDFGDRFFGLKDGRICLEGGPDCLTEENLTELYDIPFHIFTAASRKWIVGGPARGEEASR